MRRWVFWGERVLASPWRWLIVLLGLLFALCGSLSVWTEPGEGVSWSGVVVAALVCPAGLAFAVWGLLSRVHLHPDHLVHRDPFRRRTIRLEDVVAVGVQTVDDKVVWEVSVPVLRLSSGSEVALTGLAGVSWGSWRTPLLRRDVALLLAWWGGDPDAFDAPPEPSGAGSAATASQEAAPAPRAAPGEGLDGPFRSAPGRGRP